MSTKMSLFLKTVDTNNWFKNNRLRNIPYLDITRGFYLSSLSVHYQLYCYRAVKRHRTEQLSNLATACCQIELLQ
jgi:hypothetical protein